MDPDEILPVARGYAAWAPIYDDDGNSLTAIEGPTLRGWFSDLEGRDVLDLGCGTGRQTVALASTGANVTAVDASPEMMARARHTLRGYPVRWVHLELPAPLPFAEASFDLVVMSLVAEHLDDLATVMADVARVVRPGGRCLFSALHPDRTERGQKARFIDPSTGLRRQIATVHRSLDEYRTTLRNAGWSLVEERTLIVPEELGQTLPRAQPYVGLALGWASCWIKNL